MEEESFYGIERWGNGYFDVDPKKGHVIVKTDDHGSGDLYELMQSLVKRGIEAPILIRFNGIIKDRIRHLHAAFREAIHDFKYRNVYQMVFPIKANPQRHVVESVHLSGIEYEMGLEVGSKPELISVMAIEDNPERLLLCNGYKDAEYIKLALLSRKLGRRTFIIIEQAYELNLVIKEAEALGIEAEIGFRMKLATKGSGRWKESGGEHSKFGLFSHEIVACLEELKASNKREWLKLLHFHMGSQITSIDAVKKALHEASRMYTELAHEYPSLAFFDVGGGLAVDYDGTKSTSESSMNYSLEEYARDVVSAIGEACLSQNLPDPIIITETGRALVSQHAVLITEVIDVTTAPKLKEEKIPSSHDILVSLNKLLNELNIENARETFHDALEIKERILDEFVYGKLKLHERAYAEKKLWQLFDKMRELYKELEDISEDHKVLDKLLLETYFCNFSVFQSLPDSWAIQQLFPIMPIHRLNEKPTHRAILADLSCDSDGKIDFFIGKEAPENHLLLHDYRNEPYYLGIFFVGAYQEILGGLHNLFGDTNVIHAELRENGEWALSRLVEGDTIEEVLRYVQYSPENLLEKLHTKIEAALKEGAFSLTDAGVLTRRFKQSLESYTYLIV